MRNRRNEPTIARHSIDPIGAQIVTADYIGRSAGLA
jgi:hypothetical protein